MIEKILMAKNWLDNYKRELYIVLSFVLIVSVIYTLVHFYNKYRDEAITKDQQKQTIVLDKKITANQKSIDSLKAVKLIKQQSNEKDSIPTVNSHKSLDWFNTKYANKK